MVEISSTKKQDLNMTIHTVKGRVTAEEIIKVGVKQHENEPTRNVLWDFTASDFLKITSEDINEFIQIGKKYEHLRVGGKTALVFNQLSDFGMGRMIEILEMVLYVKTGERCVLRWTS
jgi:hypothetical protein